MCLVGAVVASWSLTQEVAGSLDSVKIFRKKSTEITRITED